MRTTNFPSHCGTLIFHQFYDWATTDGSRYGCLKEPHLSGIRTMIGVFVDHWQQKEDYHKLAKKFKILYQSPVLVNPSTQREYFIVIWLNEKPTKG